MPKLKSILTCGNRESIFKDKDALSVFSRETEYLCLFDRFGYLNKFTKWDVYDFKELLPASNYTGCLSDIMMNRGKEVFSLAKSAGKNLYVLWSGGVDSTAVVLSILENASPDDRKIIKILYTNSSVLEYSKFHDYLLTIPDIECIRLPMLEFHKALEGITKTDFIVTGFPADQLFGSIINQSLPFNHDDDWRKWIVQREAIEQFESAFSYYNLPVTTISQLTWFMNFACKWTIVTHSLPAFYGFPHRNTINFFETKEFQDWSVSNFDRLHSQPQKDPKFYKLDLKVFINKLFKDEEYLRAKGKIGSIGYGYRVDEESPESTHLAILEENDNVIIEKLSGVKSLHRRASMIQSRMNRLLLNYRKQSM